MHARELGKDGLTVSAIGLGCMGMSEFYGPSEEEQSIEVLHHALGAGINFWDTADMYGQGKNEHLVGRALRGHRDEVVLATKFGIVRGEDASFRGVCGTPEYVKQACDASLKRLGIDHIDLYYQHRVDPQVPIEDTVGTMSDLVAAGKVLHLGLSEASAPTLRRAAAVHPITALQSEYSLWSRDPEDQVLPACRELGISLVAYSPLGRGFLSGAIQSIDDLAPDDYRRFSPRFQGENFEKNLELVRRIEELAAVKGCTPAQLALAWLMAQGPEVVPIPGTRRIERLEENAAATEIELSAEELARIDEVVPRDLVVGARYPEAAMSFIDG
ncbi:MAG: aldo/keto reductase [Acidobacteria bacterium]|jgi:aryl-alcohol dehydrogenase-like predicted oxidoreductase|nr:aldo/keto reductase [Acidobacteriota bacterium]